VAVRTLALGRSKTIYALISAYYMHQFLLFYSKKAEMASGSSSRVLLNRTRIIQHRFGNGRENGLGLAALTACVRMFPPIHGPR
jgi:hypothetical protein